MNDNQRAAFEAWASKQGRYGSADCPVDYHRGVTRDAEKVWQAALESPEVQALRKDAERLDWLDARAHCADWVEGEPTKRVIRAEDGQVYTGDTWREAIDAAMEEQDD